MLLRALVPNGVVNWYRRRAIGRRRAINSGRSRQDIFESVYAGNQWGGAPGEFCSGSGSSEEQALAYVRFVRTFVEQQGITSVVDLGCGDFRVGRQLIMPGVQYTGIDIVRGLIEANQRAYGDEQVQFLCRDICAEEVPEAELLLVRQVFQHLSNDEILAALGRMPSFRFALVTEHHPAPDRLRVHNSDKPHGPDTRVVDGSGVFLDHPPFSLQTRVVMRVPVQQPLVGPGEVLATCLVTPVGRGP